MQIARQSYTQAWEIDGVPPSDFVIGKGNLLVSDNVMDMNTGDVYQVVSFSPGHQDPVTKYVTFPDCVFQKKITDLNLPKIILGSSWLVSSQPLDFDVERTPSEKYNTSVTAVFSQQALPDEICRVDAQIKIKDDDEWINVNSISSHYIGDEFYNSVTFFVPKGAKYRYVSAGINSLISNIETSM